MSMNERVLHVTNEQADAFYEGRVSSAEAFAAIDRVSGSAWNWYPGVLNDTREHFQARVDFRLDADLATPATPVGPEGSALVAAINDPVQWKAILATLDSKPISYYTKG